MAVIYNTAIDAYYTDKNADLLKNISLQSRFQADSVYKVVNDCLQELKFFANEFQSGGKRLSTAAQKNFENQSSVLKITVGQVTRSGLRVKQIFQTQKYDRSEDFYSEFSEGLSLAQAESLRQGLSIAFSSQYPEVVTVSVLVRNNENQPQLVISGLFLAKMIMRLAESSGSMSGFILDQSDKVLLAFGESFENFEPEKIASQINGQISPGVREIILENRIYLASKVNVGFGGMSFLNVTEKQKVLIGITLLKLKSFLIFASVFSFLIAISYFGSKKLTEQLKLLSLATKKVAMGDFEIQVKVDSSDEVGSLAQNFKMMAVEIKRLLKETKEKARMESELQTANTVQKTLFPQLRYSDNDVFLSGFYQPASECGGDWWNYSFIDGKLLLWIGDATGHGVPAALVVSAIKSASVILEKMQETSPAKILGLLNSAVHDTTKGSVNMTFFVASFDLKTKELIYANASHDPPFFLPILDGPLNKKHIQPLVAVNGRRLGEKPDSHYEECNIQMNSGDIIVFYTDGVTECLNGDGTLWSERNFVKTLLASVNQTRKPEHIAKEIGDSLNSFRSNTALNDDLTYFVFGRN